MKETLDVVVHPLKSKTRVAPEGTPPPHKQTEVSVHVHIHCAVRDTFVGGMTIKWIIEYL